MCVCNWFYYGLIVLQQNFGDEILLQWNHSWGNMIHGNELPCVAIYDFWQWITLRGNIWSLATNNIAWQMYYCHAMTVVATTLLATKSWHGNTDYLQWRCSWQMSLLLRYQPLHVPPLATKTGVASAYIVTIMNVEITSYCHARQRTTMVARNPNSCNDKLATIAIPYCNVTFCNHWQRTWFGCNFYLLQPNWAYCNVFSSLHKG
jgi:hypothetical protein